MKRLFLYCTVALAGCGEVPLQSEPVTCPPAAEVPRYSELSAIASCVGCHASTLSGADRDGAPAPINFDTWPGATRAAVVGLSAIQRGAMPPGAPLDDAEIQQWKIWSSCGRPE